MLAQFAVDPDFNQQPQATNIQINLLTRKRESKININDFIDISLQKYQKNRENNKKNIEKENKKSLLYYI